MRMHRSFAVIPTIAVVVSAWALAAARPAALAAALTAGRPTCLVTNAGGGGYRTLQSAVDAASAGDTLKVKGTCVGTTTISKNLTVDGQSYSQPLTVLKDPNQRETDADILASTNLLKSIQTDMNMAAEILSTSESARAQILALGDQIRSQAANVRPLADSVAQKFLAIGSNVVDPRMTGRGQDEVRYPVKIGGQLNWLAGGVSASDFAPASQQRDVAGILAKETKDTRDALQRLIAGDLARLNAQLRAKGLKTIDLGSIVF